MTSGSDHEEDMSMEEILASIRRFVTDQPPEASAGAKAVSLNSENAAFSVTEKPESQNKMLSTPQPSLRQPVSAYTPIEDKPVTSSSAQFPAQVLPQSAFREAFEHVVSENAIAQNPDANISPHHSARYSEAHKEAAPSAFFRQDTDDSVLTLTNPIGSAKTASSSQFAKPALTPKEHIGSAHTVVSSAGSLGRLVQTAKSVPENKTASASSQNRNMTLDQLIQDMIRPMIKQWIDTNLPSLVENMVAREIERITRHLE